MQTISWVVISMVLILYDSVFALNYIINDMFNTCSSFALIFIFNSVICSCSTDVVNANIEQRTDTLKEFHSNGVLKSEYCRTETGTLLLIL